MNKKLELDMSEILIAVASNSPERAGRILNRLDFPQKEKLAKALIVSLSATFNSLPPQTVLSIQREFGFDLATVEVT